MRWTLVVLLLAGLACEEAEREPLGQDRLEATQPATQPATKPAEPEAVALPTTFFEYVQLTDERFVDVQERTRATDVLDAGVVLIDDAVHLCGRGDLWIEYADADGTIDDTRQVHLVPDPVAYVHWAPGDGGWVPQPVYDLGGTSIRWNGVSQTVPAGIDWSTAFSQGDRVFVSAGDGPIVFVGGQLQQGAGSLQLTGTGPAHFLLDHRGVLAWRDGGDDVARYVDGKWTKPDGFPESIRQLVPMRDGTVTAIHDDADGNVVTTSVLLEAVEVDEGKILELIAQLSDRSRLTRETAYAELQTYGPAAWPIFEAQIARQPAEGRRRLQALLGEKFEPLIGDMQPMPGPALTLNPVGFGGSVMYLSNGVALPNRIANGEANAYVIPAWVVIQPGLRISRLGPTMMYPFNPDDEDHTLTAWGDEWVGVFGSEGPMRWYGNHWKPMLPAEHVGYDTFVGIDSRGRWVFRDDEAKTLILDPRLPETTPELPAWNVPLSGGTVGWTLAGWPVMKSGGAWALKEFGWVPLQPEKPEDTVLSGPGDAPKMPDGVIGRSADGTTYGGGIDTLVHGDAELTLPPEARGSIEKPLVFEIDGDPDKLLLWNAPGRLVRLKRDGDELRVVATFTHAIPNTELIDRMWLDPAGRLCIAWDGTQLVIAFPTGEVSSEMASMMPARRGR
ncbi:MAG: hypothetical protein AAGD32_16100 [Planctomycetota bacterium]